LQTYINANCFKCDSYMEFSQNEFCPNCGSKIKPSLDQVALHIQDAKNEADFGMRIMNGKTDQRALTHRG